MPAAVTWTSDPSDQQFASPFPFRTRQGRLPFGEAALASVASPTRSRCSAIAVLFRCGGADSAAGVGRSSGSGPGASWSQRKRSAQARRSLALAGIARSASWRAAAASTVAAAASSPSSAHPGSGRRQEATRKALLAGVGRQDGGGQERQDPHRSSAERRRQNRPFGGDGIADFADKKFQLSFTLPAAPGISGTIEERVIGKDIYVMLPRCRDRAHRRQAVDQDRRLRARRQRHHGPELARPGPHPAPGHAARRQRQHHQGRHRRDPRRRRPRTTGRRSISRRPSRPAALTRPASTQFSKTLGTSTIPEDVYLDGSGLARRFSVTISPCRRAPRACGGLDLVHRHGRPLRLRHHRHLRHRRPAGERDRQPAVRHRPRRLTDAPSPLTRACDVAR